MSSNIDLNLKEFENIDSSRQYETFIAALKQFNDIAEIQDLKQIARNKISKDSKKVLDAGCGPGLETISIAKNFKNTESTGIDLSKDFITTALKQAKEFGIKNCTFKDMNIENLSFDDNSFDFTRAERVLLYAPNPKIAIKELFRVTKKNSYMCIIEPDWETNTINVNNRELVRKIINHDCDNNIKNGWVGRELPSILKNLNINYSIDSRVARLPQQLALNFYLEVAKSAFENNTISNK